MYYIYALIDPRDDLPFYVGKGKGGRKFDHLKRVNQANKYKQHVIEQIRAEGLEPSIVVLIDGIHDEEEAYNQEESVVASYGRRIDGSGILTNLTSGGRGTKRTIRTEEHRKKLGWSKGTHLQESHKQSISKGMKGRIPSKEHRESIRQSRLGVEISEDSKKKISESLTGRTQSEETKRKRSETLKLRYQDPELRKKISDSVRLAKSK